MPVFATIKISGVTRARRCGHRTHVPVQVKTKPWTNTIIKQQILKLDAVSLIMMEKNSSQSVTLTSNGFRLFFYCPTNRIWSHSELKTIRPAGSRGVSPRKLPTKGAKNRKAIRLIPLIGEQLKNKNVDGGMIPFRAKTMRQNNKKGGSGTVRAGPAAGG